MGLEVPGKPRIEPLRKQVFVEAIAALRSEFVARVDANRVQISIAPGKARPKGGGKRAVLVGGTAAAVLVFR